MTNAANKIVWNIKTHLMFQIYILYISEDRSRYQVKGKGVP